jgi:hypothetical protein
MRVVAENFFTTAGGTAVHEIGFYGGCATDGLPDDPEFVGAEGPGSVFRWVSAGELAALDVRPRAVADLLFDLPDHLVHLRLGA